MISRQAFANIMNALDAQMKRSEEFGKAISQAYINAGAIQDFTNSTSYELPYGDLFDSIIEGIAVDFVSEKNSLTDVLDDINWWVFEENFGRGMFDEYEDNPNYPEIEFTNGERFVIKTANDLYDFLIREM